MNVKREIATLRLEIDRLKMEQAGAETYAGDPVGLMRAAGIEPDPWQAGVLRSTALQTLLLCTRQGGKSTTTAGKALHKALYKPGALVLLVAPSLRQSQELFHKVTQLYVASGALVPARNLSALQMELEHGSRLIALPGNEKTVRGYSGVDLLIIDEASRALDDLYYSLRPMLAVSGGQLMCLTTPWGKRGFFHREWVEGGDSWERVRVTADECPRISPAFLAEERERLPDLWYRSEYLCEFTDTVDSVFATEDVDRAFSADVPMLFGGARIAPATGATDVPEGTDIQRIMV